MSEYVKLIVLIFPMLCVSCLAGKGIQQLGGYKLLAETFGAEELFSSESRRLGADILKRCKTDAQFLNKLCDDFKQKAVDGDNVPALLLALSIHDFAPKTGEQLLLALADNSDTDAMVVLAEIYYSDDKESAFKWLKKAADQRDLDAAGILVGDYLDDLSKDVAVRYATWLVNDHRLDGYFIMSSFYLKGYGVDVSKGKACELAEKAWNAGAAEAALALALCYRDDDRALSLKWLEKGAGAGDRMAQYEWSQVLINGEYIEKDVDKGLRWLRQSADAGYLPAQYEWSQVLLGGKYIEKDIDGGLRWLRLSADAGYLPSLYDLGIIHASGFLGVEKDYELALSYFLKAAEQGDAQAQFKAGMMYIKLDDMDCAYACFQKASKQGHQKAEMILNKMVENGDILK
jgi:TPR repeat protein